MKLCSPVIICMALCTCKDINNKTKLYSGPLKDSAALVRRFLGQDSLITVRETNKAFKLMPHNTYLTYKEISRDTASYGKDTTTLLSDVMGMYEINVPKSHRYEIVFPDDSKVWLNAATKFRFNADRKDTLNFEILGEAYFINKKAATIVSPNIKVYSKADNKINIRCHKNEPSRISLLKGIAFINSYRLNPGDCAFLNGQTRIIPGCCKNDPEDPICWTKGLLSFENKNCREAFSDLSRWYKYFEYYGPDNCDAAGRLPLSLAMKDIIYFLQLNKYNISYRIDSSFGILIKQ